MASTKKVSFDDDAQRYLRNTLNEVLHGIRPSPELESELTPLRAPMIKLFEQMRRERSDFMPASEQALLLIQSCEICEQELEGWEFDTRLGYTRAEAEMVMARLQELAHNASLQARAAAS